ncbi:MurR/RpiR family transcriptional regulator [Pisciglobus halotolerans]|uniref:DNA-binding transcriptional regulator, MurR/RpiR family, contains HTH and SIS domains n=1 Tax=Pisciglobus halotolerans TaxID=745365 RepID=A0A1I3AXN1_9LACT|nr:MurR/RpiR family transcriptional regulator [Pisciglobus halotolerans]SFH54710.1 DNA-binding transcriptional regulator, MurR/RpiR family, contains HTH and SIS domains [Pisciglobus halotolerans]
MLGNNILGRIRSVMDELPKSEKKIGEFILHHPEKTIKMTTAQLGEAAQSNSPAVIRLCSRIGVNGFTKLKVDLSAEIVSEEKIEYADIQSEETMEDIKGKLLGNAFKSMEETLSLINEQILENVTEVLSKASIIYIYGIGASHLVAENIAQKWSRIGKTCICPTDAHGLITMMASTPKASVFFSVSNSGETKEIIELVSVAKKHHIKTVGLTKFGNNTLTNQVDFVLQTMKPHESRNRSAATSSLHAQFIATDLLFYYFVMKDYHQSMKKIKHTREEINRYKSNF